MFLFFFFFFFFFFFNDTATTEIYTLSLTRRSSDLRARRGGHRWLPAARVRVGQLPASRGHRRSEEHTSELQSPCNLVCRLLLEKKKKNTFHLSPFKKKKKQKKKKTQK